MVDRSFGPTVLVGLASAGLVALAGSNAWIDTGAGAERIAGQEFVELDAGLGEVPLAGALGLVLLACWGVLLVARGRWRTVLAWCAVATAVGALATWVVALLTLRDQVRESSVAGPGSGQATEDLSWTWWTWAALLGIVLSVGAALVATQRARRWPVMGRKYDAPAAPGAAPSAAAPATGPAGEVAADSGEVDPADWWKAIDEGRDPTSDGTP